MNVLCTADQDHQRWAIAVNNSNKFEDIYSMVNPLLMDYTENGATLQELPEKSPISGKRKKKLLEIEKRASKKLKNFQKLLE